MLSAPSGLAQSERACCPGQRRVSTPMSRLARSVTTCCPGRPRVLPPVVRAAHSVCHPLSESTFLNQSPYKEYTKINVPMLSRSTPSDSHPLSGSTQSVTTRCPGQHVVSPPVVWGNADCHQPLSSATRKFYWSARKEM